MIQRHEMSKNTVGKVASIDLLDTRLPQPLICKKHTAMKQRYACKYFKGKVKTCILHMPFAEHIIYLEKPRESIDKVGKLISEFSKVPVHMMNKKIRLPVYQQ